MTVKRETERAKLLEHDGIEFWIQRRWQRADGTLTDAGKRALAIAADCKRRHGDFDATKVFEAERYTKSAVLLTCTVKVPCGADQTARFWVPLSKVNDYRFVKGKVAEVERGFPFIGSKVIWEEEKRS